MELKQEITVQVKSDDIYFDLFEVESVAEGTLIRAKSKKFGIWLKSLTPGPKINRSTVNKSWLNVVFTVPSILLEEQGGRDHLNFSYRNGLFFDGQPNMIWLFQGDLEAGFELLVPEPLSLNNLEDFFTTAIDELRDIYLKYLRTGKFSAQLSEVISA
jgi:hypothetical protein